MGSEKDILEIGQQTHLLIDDYLVDDIWMIQRTPEEPVKYLNNPVFTECGGATILYDEEEKIFKMWYGIGIKGTFEAKGAYAVSKDGINWEKPVLGIVEENGSKDNNLIETTGFGSVMKDPRDPDPARRYKMMTKRAGTETSEGRAFAAFSPDGIHWTDHPGEKSILRFSSDGNGMVLYDEDSGKFINFRRPTVRAAVHGLEADDLGFTDDRVMKEPGGDMHEIPQGIGFPSDDDFVHNEEAEDYLHRYRMTSRYVHTRALRIYRESHEGMGCNRRIARSESDDFINWSIPEVIIRPDELDPPRLYSMSVKKYHGLYIGMVMLFNSWGNRRNPGCPQESETIDLHMTFSRDGWNWERLANRPVFIQRGYIGSFDGGMLMHGDPPFVEYGDDLLFFYGGMSTCHNIPAREVGVGVAKLPRERIVSRSAGEEVGVLITKPFKLDGDRLMINAAAPRGRITVEVADIYGRPIEGFRTNDCEAIENSDGFRLPVAWKTGRTLGDLAGTPIRLRFCMQKARLYSLTFGK